MRFEWSPRKALVNRRKHRVSFEEAATAFGDPFSLTIADPDHSTEEERCILLGSTSRGRVVVVVHADREDTIRIISARIATRRERMDYEEA